MKYFLAALFLLTTLGGCSSSDDLAVDIGDGQDSTVADVDTTDAVASSTGSSVETNQDTATTDIGSEATVSVESSSDVFGPSGNPTDGIGSVAQLSSGYRFTEGPAWVEELGAWLFTDIPNSRVVQVTPDGAESTFASRIGNGLIVDSRGGIVMAGNAGRDVVSFDTSGNATTIADSFQGTRFNEPNDLVELVGVGYFVTDPIFTASADKTLCQGVYLVTYSGDVTQVLCNGANPNGIVLSPDSRTLYITLSGSNQVIQASVEPTTGEVGDSQQFAQTSSFPDGMVVDGAGNVYVGADAGVEVYGSDGTSLGTITVPEKPSNLALGGPNGNTLFITAVTSVYTVDIN